jgi:sporulation protein YlmC with PRC-barrel domain
MLQLSETILNQPVMSLRTGSQVATVTSVIMNPNNLKIEGFYCEDSLENKTLVLLAQDVRDTLAQGLVVDDHEVLVAPDELVRLNDLMELNYQLIGKQVATVQKEKVGRVNNWAADTTSFYIQKLYVGQSILKSLSTGQLSIDRNQIVEITNKKIIIQELLKPQKTSVAVTAPTG